MAFGRLIADLHPQRVALGFFYHKEEEVEGAVCGMSLCPTTPSIAESHVIMSSHVQAKQSFFVSRVIRPN